MIYHLQIIHQHITVFNNHIAIGQEIHIWPTTIWVSPISVHPTSILCPVYNIQCPACHQMSLYMLRISKVVEIIWLVATILVVIWLVLVTITPVCTQEVVITKAVQYRVVMTMKVSGIINHLKSRGQYAWGCFLDNIIINVLINLRFIRMEILQ